MHSFRGSEALKNTIEPVKEEEQYLLWDIEVHKKKDNPFKDCLSVIGANQILLEHFYAAFYE